MPRRAGIGSLLQPHVDSAAREPVFRQLSAELRQGILGGRLGPGTRMPASRAFAEELRVSRNTVLGAYEQLLSEGYLEMRPGSGTYVATDLPDLPPERALAPRGPVAAEGRLEQAPRHLAKRADTLLDSENSRRFVRDVIDSSPWSPCFTPGLPDSSDFPFAAWSRLLAKTWREPSTALVNAGDPGGYLPLCAAVADYLRQVRGLDCRPADVLVVSGLRHAVGFPCRLLLGTGATVSVERPGCPGPGSARASPGAQVGS